MIKQEPLFTTIWKFVHVIAFIAVLGAVFIVCTGFGFGPGLSAPVDIHVPTSEDAFIEWKEAEHEAQRDEGHLIDLPDDHGNLVEKEFY